MLEKVFDNSIDDFVSAPNAAKLLGISRQRVVVMCQRGQLSGAQLAFRRWLIPQKTIEERKKQKIRKKSVDTRK